MSKRTFSIGSGVDCDLDRLVNTRLLVQANSGAGKSWALRRLLEQTHGSIQQLVIDPEGEFASLRERYDYVLAARQGGDTLADPRTAKLLAERLLELGVSAILDIYELKPHERVKFVRIFLDTLVEAPKHLWHPVLVLLDEAHVYAPEKGDAESADAVKSLATRGRKRGFCLIPATQRLSKLHKDVAAECNNKLIGRSSLDIDMKRAADELGFNTKAEQLSLRDLGDGEFFAFGPALTKTVALVKVGPVHTTHPKAGSHLAAVVPPPTEKVKALLPKLSDLPAEAEAREKTVADLKRDLATARRELTEARKGLPMADPRVVEKEKRVEVPVLKDGQLKRIETVLDRMTVEADRHGTAMAMFWGNLNELASSLLGAVRSVAPVPVRAPVNVMRPPTAPQPRVVTSVQQTPRVVSATNGHGALSSGERKILTALAQYPDGRTKTQVAVLTVYAHNGGGFNNYLSALRSKGFIDGGSDRLRITDGGLDALGDFAPLPTGRDLLDYWLGQLGKAERLILEQLAAEYPAALTKEQLAERTNYEASGGGFNNALSRLRTLELINGRGALRASEDLFE